MSRERYNLLDTIRGFLLINMVLYHGLYDVVHIMGVPMGWYTGPIGYSWQQGICWGFILLSGFCFRLSKRPLRHGLIILGAGVLVTVVTAIAMPSERIIFGVLYLLGLCGLIQCGVWALWSRLRLPPFPAGPGLALSALAFFLTRGVPAGYIGFEGLRLFELPRWLYRWDFMAVLGFPGPGFWSSDYFPVIPWVFLYLCGYFLWRLIGSRQRVMDRLRPGVRPLSFIGRHSLLIYLLHQPALMLIFTLIEALHLPLAFSQ